MVALLADVDDRSVAMKEADLYLPVKRFLESQRYEVKGEIHHCDVVAVRDSEQPVIVELKLSLNLNVILQAVDRLAVSPTVYIGIPSRDRMLNARRRQTVKLLRMLGVGLLTIGPGGDRARVTVVLDPAEYRPRKSAPRQARLLGEFEKRVGDPNRGGGNGALMTAYRQTALAIARHLETHGPTKASIVAAALGQPTARVVMYRDVYGWFERVALGIYRLSPRGQREMVRWSSESAPACAPADSLADRVESLGSST
jgi:hypothetical protein